MAVSRLIAKTPRFSHGRSQTGTRRQIIKPSNQHSNGWVCNCQECEMAKGQQSQKMVKKPKKDTAPPKPVSPDAVRPTVTTVVPVRGKLKNAPAR
jgi:hypothetical protein